MEVIAQDNVVEQVSGLGQVGFEFPQDRHREQIRYFVKNSINPAVLEYHIALSPNACAAVSFADNTDIHLRLIQMPLNAGTESLDKCTALMT